MAVRLLAAHGVDLARRIDAVCAFALVALAVALTSNAWREGPSQWKPDALFYQAQLLEVRGAGRAVALDQVFRGPLAAPRRAGEASEPPAERKVDNPGWVDYSSRFYRRRWVVPVLGASIAPLFGNRALAVVSLAGYALAGPALYLLLRRRFAPFASLAAAAAALALPAFGRWASQPLSDSFNVLVETLALVCAALVLDRGRRWLPLWVVSVAVLAFTKDTAIVLCVAAAWLALARRSWLTAALAATGVLAALPPLLVFGAPLRETMAYTFNGFRPPAHATWGFVAGHYSPSLKSLVENDLTYALDHPGTALLAIVGLVALLAPRTGAPDAFWSLLRAGALASFGLLALLPNYTGFRLELVFVPFVAAGLARAAEALAAKVRGRPPVRTW